MTSGETFLKPKLQGRRFDDHNLPLNILEDFSVLEELIFELAKKNYIEKNPLKKRVPNHFIDNISLKISTIEEGSVIPNLVLVALTNFATPNLPSVNNNNFRYFESARDKVFEIIEKANKGESVDIDVKYLNYFNRIGRNLRDDEKIDFLNDSSSNRNVVFDKSTRRKILLSRSEKFEYTESVNEIVLVSSVSQKNKKFEIEIRGGSIIECILHKDFKETAIMALNGYDNKCRVLLKGIGIFNEKDKLIHIDKIDSLDILDPFDVSIRLMELSELENGWYDGLQGKAFSITELEIFEKLFYDFYQDKLPLPAIFPTLSGGLVLEWKKNKVEITVEIDLSKMSATLYYFDMVNDDNDEELFIDLYDDKEWYKLNEIVEKIFDKQ